jgi:hypothetical protein
MAIQFRLKRFDSKFYNSRITSANVQGRESWLGFFMGPALAYIVFYNGREVTSICRGRARPATGF